MLTSTEDTMWGRHLSFPQSELPAFYTARAPGLQHPSEYPFKGRFSRKTCDCGRRCRNCVSRREIQDLISGDIDTLTSTDSQWLIEVNRQLPSALLDGFDISSEQYPSKAWLSPQISLAELDITKPIPSTLESKYDVVHVQLFLCVIQKDGPAKVLAELYKMLSTSHLVLRNWRVPLPSNAYYTANTT